MFQHDADVLLSASVTIFKSGTEKQANGKERIMADFSGFSHGMGIGGCFHLDFPPFLFFVVVRNI